MATITDAACVSPGRPSRPGFAQPLGATDCHAHVFGPFERFPLVHDRLYTPAELPGERYLQTLDGIGFSRGVLVQPVAHGTDCGALLHALDLDPARLRGVALITPDITDEQLRMLHQGGIRGARFSQPPLALSRGSVGFDALELLAPRLVRLGWHAQIWAPCEQLASLVARLAPTGLPLVVDHMGSFDVRRGILDPSFQALLRLLGAGRIWLKLIAYRLSGRYPDYEDIVPFHHALLATNAERLLWGSDWPHVHMHADMPDIGHLVDLFDGWTVEEAVRRRILVDNPAVLYGF